MISHETKRECTITIQDEPGTINAFVKFGAAYLFLYFDRADHDWYRAVPHSRVVNVVLTKRIP